MFSESRLIGYTLATLNKQRTAANVAPVQIKNSKPVVVPTRLSGTTQAKANVAAQSANRSNLGTTSTVKIDGKDVSVRSVKNEYGAYTNPSQGNILPTPMDQVQYGQDAFNQWQAGVLSGTINPETQPFVEPTYTAPTQAGLDEQGRPEGWDRLLNYDPQGNLLPNRTDTRAAAGAPLVSPQAGARGKAGSLGTPQQSQTLAQKLAAIDAKADADIAAMGASAGRNGAPTADQIRQNAAAARQAVLDQVKAQQADDALRRASKGNLSAPLPSQKTSTNTSTGSTPKVETPEASPFDQERACVATLRTSIANLKDPNLKMVAEMLVSNLEGDISRRESIENLIKASLPTDEELAAELKSSTDYIAKNQKDQEDVANQIASTMQGVAAYNRDLILADQKIAQARFDAARHDQVRVNLEAEKVLRRQLNAMGVGSGDDSNNLGYLQGKIQEGVDKVTEMTQIQNLTDAKYTLAATRGFQLEMQQSLDNLFANMTQIKATANDQINEAKKAVSTSKSERQKTIIKMLEDRDKKLSAAWKEAGDGIADAQSKYQASLDKANSEKDTPKDRRAFTSSIRSQIQTNKTITQANDANGFYQALVASYGYYQKQLTDPSLSSESKNAAQTAVIGSFARILDPNSVVRNEEYERQVYGQSWINTVRGLFEKASSGGSGMTEGDITAMKHVADQIHESWEKRLDENMQGFIMEVDDWNSDNPNMFIPYEQVLPVARLLLPTQEYDALDARIGGGSTPKTVTPPDSFQSWISMTGTGEVVGGSPYHVGIDQYALDLDGRIGDPLTPVVGGMVSAVGRDSGGYGNSVTILDDEGNEHLYGHLDEINVRQGQRVDPGMVFGTMGNTGKVIARGGGDGSHLHYRVTRNGKAIALNSIKPSPAPNDMGGRVQTAMERWQTANPMASTEEALFSPVYE